MPRTGVEQWAKQGSCHAWMQLTFQYRKQVRNEHRMRSTINPIARGIKSARFGAGIRYPIEWIEQASPRRCVWAETWKKWGCEPWGCLGREHPGKRKRGCGLSRGLENRSKIGRCKEPDSYTIDYRVWLSLGVGRETIGGFGATWSDLCFYRIIWLWGWWYWGKDGRGWKHTHLLGRDHDL